MKICTHKKGIYIGLEIKMAFISFQIKSEDKCYINFFIGIADKTNYGFNLVGYKFKNK